MGNFHCIDDGCAEIRYQPYRKTGGVRYRYPGEDWVTVDGDDYRCDERLLLSSTWQIVCNFSFVYYGQPGLYFFGFNRFIYNNGDTIQANTVFGGSRTELAFRGEVISSQILPAENQASVTFLVTTLFDGKQETNSYFFQYKPTASNLRLSLAWVLEDPSPYSSAGTNSEPSIEFLNNDGTKPRKKIVFSVTKNGEEIFSREADVCPEVEILDDECELSDRYETIKVEKVLYLERIEIRDQDIRSYGVGGTLIDTSPLPDECLNIYKTFTAAPPFPNNTVPTAAIFNPYEFVAQISSDVGCPPPEYTVVCRCGEECPADTCPVFCGDHVCCHDPNTGNSVHQIPLGEYSGGGL